MKSLASYLAATAFALNPAILHNADPAQVKQLADYAKNHGRHSSYVSNGHDIDSFTLSFPIMETEKDRLSRLEVQISRLIVDWREVLSLTGRVYNPVNGDYMLLQLDDGGLEKELPLDGKVDTAEISFSKDGGRTFQQTAVPADINKNRQNIFDEYVGKLLRIIKGKT